MEQTEKELFVIMKKVIKLILAAAFILTVIVVAVSIFSDSDAPGTDNQSPSSGSSVSSEELQGDKVVYEDDLIKLWFVGAYEQPDLAKDTCYFTMKLENKTDKQITLYPLEASANDFMINIYSGVPLTVNPKKIGQNTFFFNYSGFVNGISEINSIQFKAMLLDENSETVEETEISFKIK